MSGSGWTILFGSWIQILIGLNTLHEVLWFDKNPKKHDWIRIINFVSDVPQILKKSIKLSNKQKIPWVKI